jgi:dTDP-4-amino-4,6-dideoxygalactose transaminase
MNGRLDTIQAAVLLAKLPLLEGELAARAALAARYDAALARARNHVVLPARPPGAESAWGIYSVLLPDAPARERVQKALAAQGVPTAIYYPRPLHHQPAYRDHHAGAVRGAPPLPVSEMLCERILALPMHPYLSAEDAERVSGALLSAL